MPLFFAHNIVIFLFILFILFITVSSNTSKLVLVFFSPRFPPPCFFPFHFVHVTPKQRHLLPKKAKMKEINKTEWAGRTDFSQENFYRARNLCFQRILTRCRGKGKNKGHFFFCFWGKVALNIFGVCVWGGSLFSQMWQRQQPRQIVFWLQWTSDLRNTLQITLCRPRFILRNSLFSNWWEVHNNNLHLSYNDSNLYLSLFL